MSLTKVSYSMVTGAPINVLDHGADPSGVADSTSAFDAAIAAATDDNIVIVPAGTYKLTDTISLATSAIDGARLIGQGKPTLNFVGLTSLKNGVALVGYNYRQTQLENFIIQMNSSGLNGVHLTSGDRPIVRNVDVYEPGSAGFALIANGDGWIENASFKNLCAYDSGLSAFYLEASGSSGAGAFINECVFEDCEVRGVSLLGNNGAAVFATCSSTLATAKISNIRWASCNFDAQRAKAVAAGFDINPNPMYLAYTAGAVNLYESWHIDTGGWETTTGSADYRRLGLIYCVDGAVARAFSVQNIVPGNWSQGGYYNLIDYVIQDVQYGTFRAQFPNSWKQQELNASTTYDFDVLIPNAPQRNTSLTGRVNIAAAYELSFFHLTYTGTDQESYTRDFYIVYNVAGADAYGVMMGASTSTAVGLDQFTVNSVTVVNAAGTTTLNAANPPAYVRVNLTTTANWGAGGGAKYAFGIVSYKGASHEQYAG